MMCQMWRNIPTLFPKPGHDSLCGNTQQYFHVHKQLQVGLSCLQSATVTQGLYVTCGNSAQIAMRRWPWAPAKRKSVRELPKCLRLLSTQRYIITVQELVEDIVHAGGIITEQDLHEAQPEIKPAITAQVWGLDIITVPPPSSGAVLIAALQILQGAPLSARTLFSRQQKESISAGMLSKLCAACPPAPSLR